MPLPSKPLVDHRMQMVDQDQFPDEKDNPSLEVKRYPPGEDFRWVVPPRGTLP